KSECVASEFFQIIRIDLANSVHIIIGLVTGFRSAAVDGDVRIQYWSIIEVGVAGFASIVLAVARALMDSPFPIPESAIERKFIYLYKFLCRFVEPKILIF